MTENYPIGGAAAVPHVTWAIYGKKCVANGEVRLKTPAKTTIGTIAGADSLTIARKTLRSISR
jgi:hypothetical protein